MLDAAVLTTLWLLEAFDVRRVVEWVGGGKKKILARHLRNEDADLAITSECGSEHVAAKISFVPSPKRSPERTAITLHEELAITSTWRANCQMVRSGQPTGVLIPVV
jgi:hypothetical protein